MANVVTLLLKEEATTSLSTLVEKSQQRKPPHPEYTLNLTPNQLEFVLRSKPTETLTNSPDEGFESDIDSLSIVSSDGSFAPETKTTETDSANGSAASDSDTENAEQTKESYNLVDCVCYTDVKLPDILIFVIKTQALVLKFDDLNHLKNFYVNFTALKAVTNQKTYTPTTKFNLLQRTDQNGVTHIEITREPEINRPTSKIISINTPETYSPLVITPKRNETLRKVWNSAEDLLDIPKRPDRRKKIKGKAPAPPVIAPPPPVSDVLRGEYVRVNVNADAIKHKDFIAKSQLKERKTSNKSQLVALLSPKYKAEPFWTNSVPRSTAKVRSKSETRHFTPMAYRYIDTAHPPPVYSDMGNRLFGLSPKLKDLNSGMDDSRWGGSTCDLVRRDNTGNLKSVIKKNENKKKNEKKVTFSAYTTVQVV